MPDVEDRLQELLGGLPVQAPPDPLGWVRARVRRQRRALAVPAVLAAVAVLTAALLVLPGRTTSEQVAGVAGWPARGDLRGSAEVLREAERAWDAAAAEDRLPVRRGHVEPVWVGTVRGGRVALVRGRTARGPWLVDVVEVATTPVTYTVGTSGPEPRDADALVLSGPVTCVGCLDPGPTGTSLVLLPPGARDVEVRTLRTAFTPAALQEGLAGPFPLELGAISTPGSPVVARLGLRYEAGRYGVSPCGGALAAPRVSAETSAPSWSTVGAGTAEVDDAVLLAQSLCQEDMTVAPLAGVPGVGRLVELTAGRDRYLALRTGSRFTWRTFSTVSQVEGFRLDDGSGRATLVALARPGVARLVLTVRGREAARVEGRLLVHPLRSGDQSRSTLTAYDVDGRVLEVLRAQAITPPAHR